MNKSSYAEGAGYVRTGWGATLGDGHDDGSISNLFSIGLAETGYTINTDWTSQGAWTDPGARVDLHYEYIDHHQLNKLQLVHLLDDHQHNRHVRAVLGPSDWMSHATGEPI